MTAPIDDIAARRAVWAAWSELYLDTDPAPLHDACARVLSASPYTIDALEQILRRDVHPVLRGNLLVPAGVWDGFDLDWLAARIIQRLRLPRWRRLFDGMLGSEADAIWSAQRPRIEALRRRGIERPRTGEEERA